jgi:hypothetical protein
MVKGSTHPSGTIRYSLDINEQLGYLLDILCLNAK